jgi:hypothetical protein
VSWVIEHAAGNHRNPQRREVIRIDAVEREFRVFALAALVAFHAEAAASAASERHECGDGRRG